MLDLRELPWYAKVILAGGILLLFAFTYQRGQLSILKKYTKG